MGKDILISDVPENILRWIDKERNKQKITQKQFIMSVFDKANPYNGAMPLFESIKDDIINVPEFVPFKYLDLFAGIGGFRIALDKLGGECVFSCECDKYCQQTYNAWFGEVPKGDIRNIETDSIPDHDILAAGFPCQPFSLAGVSKKNSLGQKHGFKDITQGTLFFSILSIIEKRRPPVIFLENVKNLLSHDKGKTWTIIKESLISLNYSVFNKVIDAVSWVPQHRERVIIVGFDRDEFGDDPPFNFPEINSTTNKKLEDILEKNPDNKYTLSDKLWNYLKGYAKKHKDKGNGFGYGLVDLKGIARTLSARYYKDGSEILIPQGNGKNPRRLTPREAAKLMGFNDDLPIIVSDTQAYKQFGNAVVPHVIEAVGREILRSMCWKIINSSNGCLIKNRY